MPAGICYINKWNRQRRVCWGCTLRSVMGCASPSTSLFRSDGSAGTPVWFSDPREPDCPEKRDRPRPKWPALSAGPERRGPVAHPGPLRARRSLGGTWTAIPPEPMSPESCHRRESNPPRPRAFRSRARGQAQGTSTSKTLPKHLGTV